MAKFELWLETLFVGIRIYGNQPSLDEYRGLHNKPVGKSQALHFAKHLLNGSCSGSVAPNVRLVFPPGNSHPLRRRLLDDTSQTEETGYLVGNALLIQHKPGTAVAMQTRDCPTVVLIDPKSKLVAVIHAGRNELTPGDDILTLVKDALIEAGADLPRLHAYIVGSIGRDQFAHDKIPEKVAPFVKEFGGEIIGDQARLTLDLPLVIRRYLERFGVPADCIHWDGVCTVTHEGLSSKRGTAAGLPNKQGYNNTFVVMR